MTDHITTPPVPTLEQFMALPQPDEPDEATPDFGQAQPPLPSVDPGGMSEVLARLDRIASMIDEPVQLRTELDVMTTYYENAMAGQAELRARIDETLAAIKTSVSKVAKDVRRILEPEPLAPAPIESAAAEQPASEVKVDVTAVDPAAVAAEAARLAEQQLAAQLGQPANGQRDPAPANAPSTEDTPETWRAYAVSCGIPEEEVAKLNRSQIRSRLGIPQPVPGQEG